MEEKYIFPVPRLQLNLTSTFTLRIFSLLRMISTDKKTDFVLRFYKQKLKIKKKYITLYSTEIKCQVRFFTVLETTGVVREWDLWLDLIFH